MAGKTINEHTTIVPEGTDNLLAQKATQQTGKFTLDALGAYLGASLDYYATSEFINTSAGVGDAGKPIVLDGTGKIASSMLPAMDFYATSEFINASAGVADAGKPIVLDGTGKIASSMLPAMDFYATSEFINTSAGVADAGKPIVLDGTGKIASSMLAASTAEPPVLLGLNETVDGVTLTKSLGDCLFTANSTSVSFTAIASVSDGARTGTVKLYNVTDAEFISSAEVSTSSTTPVKLQVAVTVGAGAGEMDLLAEKIYEVWIENDGTLASELTLLGSATLTNG